MHSEASRIFEFAQWFHAHADSRLLRASDPDAFVRMAYIAKGTLDRMLGTGNPHSRQLAQICDEVHETQERQAGDTMDVTASYRQAARVLRIAAFGRLEASGDNLTTSVV